MIPVVNLVAKVAPAASVTGMVYSTNPEEVECDDGYSYFIKGPGKETVFAELGGCLLASEVSIPVPDVAVCVYEAERYAASRVVEGMRNTTPWLRNPTHIENAGDVFRVIVVDTWLGNNDRNMGNILGSPVGEGRIKVVMIDFEKSATLRGPHPLMSSAGLSDKSLWPRDELGTILREQKPLYPPPDVCERITAMRAVRYRELLGPLADSLGGVPWFDSSIQALLGRGQRIARLAEGVWQAA